jgi:hypothetical protein
MPKLEVERRPRQKRRDFVKDLDLQRIMIVERVAQTRPDLALDLMWRFMALTEPVINRVGDSNGSVRVCLDRPT